MNPEMVEVLREIDATLNNMVWALVVLGLILALSSWGGR